MDHSIKVGDIMTREVVTIDVNKPLREANKLFSKAHIRHLPVVSGSKLVGILSQTDILRMSFGNAFDDDDAADEAVFEMLSINQVMKHSPVTINEGDPLVNAVKILSEREFHALPVLKNKDLVGIVTTTDIMKYFLRQF